MSTPRVSIGLPVYNGAKYVGEAIESILAQTYSDFELVISDNGSSDATEEICRDFAARDSRIRYTREPRNRGAAWNFNRTFELSGGEYFKWLAHDDVIGPHYLASAVDALDRDATLVLCHSRTGIIDRCGRLIGDYDSDESEAWELQGMSPKVELKRLKAVSASAPHRRLLGVLLYSIRCHEVFGLIRSSAMRKTGLHHPYCSGEKVFLAELSLLGPFREVGEVLSFSRWHPERFSSNASARAQSLHMDPSAARRFPWPRQIRSTWGYCLAIVHGELGWCDRSLCMLVLARFVLQAKKWRRIVVDYIRGVGQIAELPEASSAGSDQPAPSRHWTSISSAYSEGTV
jgi:glycosyltransferase involved in cell wall biosynthesis